MNAHAKTPPQSVPDSKKTKWFVGRGSATVKIYRTPHGQRDYFTLSYWINGQRRRQVFRTLRAAKREASIKAVAFSNGDLGVVQMTNADSAAYHRAIALLAPIKMPLESAAAEIVRAVGCLGTVTLSQAVDFYISRNPGRFPTKTAAEVAEELIRLKREDQLNGRYVYQLQIDLKRFSDRFDCRLADIRGTDIDTWLRELGVGPCRRNNFRTTVQKLFRFAIARKYLPKDHDEMDSIPVAKLLSAEIEIFTPEEMTDILSHAHEDLVPFLALGAFSGIRHAEIQKLKWTDIHLDAGIIEIRAANAKTASRRIVPVSDNLRAWLQLHRKEDGLICKQLNMAHVIRILVRHMNQSRRAAWAKSSGVGADQLAETEKRVKRDARKSRNAAGKLKPGGTAASPGAETAEAEGWRPFRWKRNALRHSYISYRVAAIQSVAQVALEAGNSPRMIFKHYRELVRPEAAKAWFSILPADCLKKAEAGTA